MPSTASPPATSISTPPSSAIERRILVSELSGRSNIMAMTTRHNLQNDRPLMDKILAQVVSLENAGYQFESAEASFDLLVRRCAGTFQPHFERLSYHVVVGWDDHHGLQTEATVKLRIGEKVQHEVAEGDGPVNALDAALRKALAASFPNLAEMHLVDYKVRVINSDAGTAAGVRVVIESRDAARRLGNRRRQRKRHRSQLDCPGRRDRIQVVQGRNKTDMNPPGSGICEKSVPTPPRNLREFRCRTGSAFVRIPLASHEVLLLVFLRFVGKSI